jgi:CubicO group peptidase (beta-lactamase class C family)
MNRSILATGLCVFGILICGISAGAPDDPVAIKLNDAKNAHAKALVQFRDEVADWFDKEDAAARKRESGVTEAVKRVVAEKKAFEEKGVLPMRAPLALKGNRVKKASDVMVKAYKAASDDYLRLKKDDKAAAVEQELEAFKRGDLGRIAIGGKLPGNKIAAALQPFVDSHSLAGAVALVADKDKVLSIDAVGFADIADQKPMKPNSLFWIASQSKSLTAAAFMILVDEGKVKLDDPVEKLIPEFKDVMVAEGKGKDKVLKKPSHPITIRQILSHTSGLPFSTSKESPTLDKLTLSEAVKNYAQTPLQSEPGTKYSYSNAGINTAGRIIEVVSGMPYEVFLDKRLLGPLGMKDTTFWPNEEQLGRLAKSYRPNKTKDDLEEFKIGQLKYPLNDSKRQPMPAGGYFSTAGDVALFCQMMLNGGTLNGKRVLSEDAVKQLTTKQTGDLVKDNYGLGFSTGGSYGHGGAHATNMSVDPKKGLIYVWMVQHAGFPKDGGNSHGAFRKAADEAFGKAK